MNESGKAIVRKIVIRKRICKKNIRRSKLLRLKNRINKTIVKNLIKKATVQGMNEDIQSKLYKYGRRIWPLKKVSKIMSKLTLLKIIN